MVVQDWDLAPQYKFHHHRTCTDRKLYAESDRREHMGIKTNLALGMFQMTPSLVSFQFGDLCPDTQLDGSWFDWLQTDQSHEPGLAISLFVLFRWSDYAL